MNTEQDKELIKLLTTMRDKIVELVDQLNSNTKEIEALKAHLRATGRQL